MSIPEASDDFKIMYCYSLKQTKANKFTVIRSAKNSDIK